MVATRLCKKRKFLSNPFINEKISNKRNTVYNLRPLLNVKLNEFINNEIIYDINDNESCIDNIEINENDSDMDVIVLNGDGVDITYSQFITEIIEGIDKQ